MVSYCIFIIIIKDIENNSDDSGKHKMTPENNGLSPEQNSDLSTKMNTSGDNGDNGDILMYFRKTQDLNKIVIQIIKFFKNRSFGFY